MEKKTVQRIIGIVVVLALIAILLPVLLNTGPSNKVASIKAPPFPDQPQDTQTPIPALQPQTTPPTAPTTVVKKTNQPTSQQPVKNQPANTPITTTSANTVAPVDKNHTVHSVAPVNLAPATTEVASVGNTSSPTPMTDKEEAEALKTAPTTALPTQQSIKKIATNQQQPVQTPSIQTAQAAPAKPAEPVLPQAQPTKVANSNPSETAPKLIVHTHHKKITTAAAGEHVTIKHAHVKPGNWVVQLGSFKEKSNATRLVDQLRNKGFAAFTHEATSITGSPRTHVLVGPGTEKSSAIALAGKLEQETQIKGIVVGNKPLDL